MRNKLLRALLLLGCLGGAAAHAQVPIPRPDHVVVVILENHAYSQIIGNTDAPYINALANSSRAALFTQSYAITHPSQPNYIDLYSGCNQGVLLDFLPSGYPFTTPNLGRQLIDSGFTWASYSEDLPSIGSDIETSLAYVRRHNPAANWVGTGTNQIPATTNLPFTAFPSNFDSLPTVCFVAPNLDHDMHDGSVTTGDTWVHDNLDAYAAWARTHNSLLILTFDEDDGLIISPNKIVTIFVGEDVVQGQYSNAITHYNVLRTIEEMYGLPPICNAAQVTTIRECWAGIAAADPISPDESGIRIHPNPSHDHLWIEGRWDARSEARLYNLTGQLMIRQGLSGIEGQLDMSALPAGVYLLQVQHQHGLYQTKVIKE